MQIFALLLLLLPIFGFISAQSEDLGRCSLYRMVNSTFIVFSQFGFVCVRPGYFRSICKMNRMISEDLRALKTQNRENWNAVKVLRVNETKFVVLRYDGTRRDDVKWTALDTREMQCPGRHSYPEFSAKFGSTHEPVLYDQPKTENFKDHYNGPLCVPKYAKLSPDGSRFVIADVEYDYERRGRYIHNEPAEFRHLPFPMNCSEWPEYNKQMIVRYRLRNVGKDKVCQRWVDENQIDFSEYDPAMRNSRILFGYVGFDDLESVKRGTIYGTIFNHNVIRNVLVGDGKQYQANFMTLKKSARQEIDDAVAAGQQGFLISPRMYDECRLREFRTRDNGELPTSVLIEN